MIVIVAKKIWSLSQNKTIALKQSEQEPKKKCKGKELRNKFFVHKAESFWKPSISRSKSPTKGVLSNIHNSSRKIKLLKLNSVAFKKKSTSKVSDNWEETSGDQTNSNLDELECRAKFSSSK